ncbi:hypothetical protein NPIL_470201 [Nephila pilipes]|uniref:Uncharacterized protein n=1 Tax=Nephila pilipes TaxID=299642 RepID=A0A8X6NFM6_NEPPI|nr:hypothetical protein NPIL_470201 [Nephila pilipes]
MANTTICLQSSCTQQNKTKKNLPRIAPTPIFQIEIPILCVFSATSCPRIPEVSSQMPPSHLSSCTAPPIEYAIVTFLLPPTFGHFDFPVSLGQI